MKPSLTSLPNSKTPVLTLVPKLSNFRLFRSFSTMENERLKKYYTHQQFKAGEALFREGEPLKDVFCILKGMVKFCKKTLNGKNIAFSLFGEGDIFELMTTDGDEIHLFSAFAATETSAFKIQPGDFREYFMSHPTFANRILYQKIRSLKGFYFSRLVSTESVETRMAYFLLDLAHHPGMARFEGKKLVFDVPLTRRDIAEITNTSVETSIRVVRKWSKKRLVTVSKRRLVIQDLQAFRKIIAGLPLLPD
ncbi:MAG TPA: Crp/Fnr family transcriptional regulator [bacterium]